MGLQLRSRSVASCFVEKWVCRFFLPICWDFLADLGALSTPSHPQVQHAECIHFMERNKHLIQESLGRRVSQVCPTQHLMRQHERVCRNGHRLLDLIEDQLTPHCSQYLRSSSFRRFFQHFAFYIAFLLSFSFLAASQSTGLKNTKYTVLKVWAAVPFVPVCTITGPSHAVMQHIAVHVCVLVIVPCPSSRCVLYFAFVYCFRYNTCPTCCVLSRVVHVCVCVPMC